MFLARNALSLAGGASSRARGAAVSSSSPLLFIKHAPFPGAATRRRLSSSACVSLWIFVQVCVLSTCVPSEMVSFGTE
jgi:hypothetical protein